MMRCVQYGIYERTLIFSLKYNGKKYIAREIAKMMRDRLREARIDFDVIVPVPMYAEKERARGFNHAALIGQYLGKEMGKPMVPDALRRTRQTRPMRGLSPEERKKNIAGSMAPGPDRAAALIRGKRVLLLEIKRRVSIQSNDLRKPLISRGFWQMRLCIGEARAGFVA